MKILNIKITAWYKALHIFFACAWFGSVLAVVLIYLLSSSSTVPEVVRHNSSLMEAIDLFIIVPSSVACYILGLMISWKTKWGFWKYKWIAVKLIVGTALILFGMIFLGPWIMTANGMSDFNEFQSLQHKLGISMIGQAFVIAFTILISSIKPWGKLKKN